MSSKTLLLEQGEFVLPYPIFSSVWLERGYMACGGGGTVKTGFRNGIVRLFDRTENHFEQIECQIEPKKLTMSSEIVIEDAVGNLSVTTGKVYALLSR